MNSSDATQILAGSLREPVSIPDHTLLRVIGRGSYGEVWEARNVMGTPRAVKIVRRQDFDDARPFDREFEGIQRYEPVSRSHAGLVQVLHVGKDPTGDYFYYVMELGDRDDAAGPEVYVPKTLRSELQRHGTLPVPDCIEMGIALASGLGHLHRSGLVHRDVKPSNIIFVNGLPKLADVGLVAGLSDTRSMVGTEGYFAPEGTGQPRCDVFSLGKVLYECITGMDRQQFPDIPESWGSGAESRAAFEFMEIVLRAAESDPARRYADTDEMLSDLALLKAGKSLRHLRRVETRLKRAGQVLMVSALWLSIAGGAWYYERHRRGQVEAAEATATRARQRTQELLAESLVAEARAVRLSGQAGAREKALAAVRRALQAGAPLFDLRTQAASALALTDAGDLDPAGEIASAGHRVIWSPGATHAVLTATASGRTRIVDRSTGREIAGFDTEPRVLEVFVSRGARWLVTTHEGYHLSLWDTSDGKKRWTLPAVQHAPTVSFSNDGTWLVASADNGIMAHACAEGQTVELKPGTPPLRSILLSPDGQWIATLPETEEEGKPAGDLGFRIYAGLPGSMPTPEEVAGVRESKIESDIRLEGPSISADSRYLAAAVSEDRLRVWEMPSMSQVAWLRGHQRSVRGTTFHPGDSSIIASTSWDGTTQLWDIPTRQRILAIPSGGEQVILAPDRGEILIRTWEGDAIRSAPLSHRSALRVMMLPAVTPSGLFAAVSFNPDGSFLTAGGDSGILVWETDNGRVSTAQVHGKSMDWRYAIFSPEDGSLYFSGREGLFRRSVVRDNSGAPVLGDREQILHGFASGLQWCGSTLAVSGRFDDKRQPGVTLLHADGSVRHLAADHAPDQIAASPDGRWLVGTRYPGSGGTLWDVSAPAATGRPVSSPSRAAFAFTSDSRVLITGTDRSVSFSSPADPARAVAPPLPRHNCEVVPAHAHSSSAAGLTAVATGPTEITLCDTATLRPILALDSSLTPFDCHVAFSPDGSRLALAGGVSRVIVWDIAWIREQLTLLGLGW